MQTVVQAMQAAGGAGYEPLSEAFNETPFETVLGTVRFDENGDADIPAYTIYEWVGGQISPLAE